MGDAQLFTLEFVNLRQWLSDRAALRLDKLSAISYLLKICHLADFFIIC